MATYKLKRKNFGFISGAVKGGLAGAILGAIPFFSKGGNSSDKGTVLVSATLLGALVGGICGYIKSFFSSKSNSGKYKASPEEIQAILPMLPKEYEIMKKIKLEVMRECRFIFASDELINFYCNTLPGFLNLNGEEWIAGWARETEKDSNGKMKYSPILTNYNCDVIYLWDFTRSEWFAFVGKDTFTFKKDKSPLNTVLNDLMRHKEFNAEYAKEPGANLTFAAQIDTYLDLNIKLIKKYGKL